MILVSRNLGLVGKNMAIDYFKASIVCNFESGVHFVKHNDISELEIGKIIFGSTAVKEHIILTVKSSDTDIPLDKLEPLTMVQRRNKTIVVVCSVEHDTGHFVMILSDKRGPEAVEVLKINYAASKIKVYPSSDTGNSQSSETKQKANIAETKSPDHSKAVLSTEPLIQGDTATLEIGATLGERLVSREPSTLGDDTPLEEAATDKEEAQSGSIAESTDRETNTTGNVCHMTNSTVANILKLLNAKSSNKVDGLVTELSLQQIAEATVTDLEMDQDGNIMFLLKRKDGGTYCVTTKYFMP